MPDARLQRTRDAYAPPAGPIRGPRVPARPYQTFTDPSTGHTTRVYQTERFVPWNTIEGDFLESAGQ